MKKWPKKVGLLAQKLKSILRLTVAKWKISLPVAIFIAFGFFTVHNLNTLTFAYSYSGNNCTKETLVLPSNNLKNDSPYNVSFLGGLTLAGKKIISTSSCFKMTKPIDPGVSYSLKTNILSRTYNIKTDPYPIISARPSNYLNVPTDSAISFSSNVSDNTFNYYLVSNNQKTDCTNNNLKLTCNVKKLSLNDGAMYDATLIRQLDSQKVDNVSQVALVTLDPITITDSTIQNDSKILDKPKNVILTFDKELQSVSTPELTINKSGTKQVVASTYLVQGNKLTLNFNGELERGFDYELVLKEARGKNGEKFASPYTLKFKTLEGPSYSGIKLRDRALPVNQIFTINFDQQLLASQDFSKVIKIRVDGQDYSASYQMSGNVVNVIPNNNLPACAAINIVINGAVQNTYTVSKNNNASFNSRTTCATIYSIGNSAEGRPITAYQFGNGTSTVLYVGTIHGDEANTKRLLDKWIDDIEGNPGRIPAGRKVVIVPLANPDGYARGTRINARGVDLNRNFAANNWKSSVKMPWGAVLETGGGTEPISEPESQAIKNFIANKNPTFIMTFHSKASIVEANEAGNSVAIGNIYAKYSGYANRPASTNGGTFNYDTTGSLEEWGKDKLNLPIILIELATRTDDEFSRNKEAMWDVL